MASRSMHFDDVAERSDLVTINVQEVVNNEVWELGIVKDEAHACRGFFHYQYNEAHTP